MIFKLLFPLFFKTGLFTVGGGLASIPILHDEILERQWMNEEEFVSAIAVAQSAPGSIGVNLATYLGVEQFGILGGIIAAVSLTIPSLLIITCIARFIPSFSSNSYVKGAFTGVRPAVTGLIAAVAFSLSITTLFPTALPFQPIKLFYFLAILTIQIKFQFKSIYLILIGAVAGILLL